MLLVTEVDSLAHFSTTALEALTNFLIAVPAFTDSLLTVQILTGPKANAICFAFLLQ